MNILQDLPDLKWTEKDLKNGLWRYCETQSYGFNEHLSHKGNSLTDRMNRKGSKGQQQNMFVLLLLMITSWIRWLEMTTYCVSNQHKKSVEETNSRNNCRVCVPMLDKTVGKSCSTLGDSFRILPS